MFFSGENLQQNGESRLLKGSNDLLKGESLILNGEYDILNALNYLPSLKRKILIAGVGAVASYVYIHAARARMRPDRAKAKRVLLCKHAYALRAQRDACIARGKWGVEAAGPGPWPAKPAASNPARDDPPCRPVLEMRITGRRQRPAEVP